MVESIRKTIDVSSTTPTVLARKTFGKALFIIDALVPVEADDRLVRYDSLADVITGEGSNSEAEKFATRYFANGAYGSKPPYMWVLKVDITVGAEDLAEKLTEALELPNDYYFITSDAEFTTEQKTTISTTVETFSDNWYRAMHDEVSANAYNDAVSTDIAPVLTALSYKKTICNYSPVDGGSLNQYLTGAVCGELNSVEYTTAKPKWQPAKKPKVGVLVNGLSNSNLTNLDDKFYNYYAETSTIANNNWYGLNSKSVAGTSFINDIAVDYMEYNVTVTLADLLINTNIIGFDPKGFNLIEDTLDRQMTVFANGDILSIGGITEDGEYFPNGFKVIMPDLATIPAIDKQNGELKNIVIEFLPKYSITKFVIVLEGKI